MKYAIWVMVLLLVVLHQDNWFWNDGTLVFGFLPMGMFYHVCLSVAASVVWLLACQFAWPENLDGKPAESKQAESKQAEPKVAEPKQAEPKQAESKQEAGQ